MSEAEVMVLMGLASRYFSRRSMLGLRIKGTPVDQRRALSAPEADMT